jgi:hypothetical protein
MTWLNEQAKYLIEVIARGVEFAAAMVIALAAIAEQDLKNRQPSLVQ